jgi:DNA-directed RNA polymerase specialized sigma24 family protein
MVTYTLRENRHAFPTVAREEQYAYDRPRFSGRELGPVESARRSELAGKVQWLLERLWHLKPKYAEAARAYYLDGQTDAAIAQRLEVCTATVHLRRQKFLRLARTVAEEIGLEEYFE